MSMQISSPRRWPTGLVIVATGFAAAVTFWSLPAKPKTQSAVADGAVAAVALLAAGLIAWAWQTRRPTGANRYFVPGLVMLGIASVGFAAADLRARPRFGPGPWDIAFLAFLPVMLWPALAELREHFRPEDRREIEVDILLMSVSLAAIGYLAMRPSGASSQAEISSAIFSILSATQITAFAALAIWVPSPSWIARSAAFLPLTVAIYMFGWSWVHGTYRGGVPTIDALLCVGALALASVACLEPGPTHGETLLAKRWGRPVLTFLAVAAAVTALALFAELRELRRGEAGNRISLL